LLTIIPAPKSHIQIPVYVIKWLHEKIVIYGKAPKSVLARHYTDYNPERLRIIYEEANLKVLI